MIFLCLALSLIAYASACAQGPVRVQCNQFTINVPSQNADCYQINDNIPVPEGALPEEIKEAQIASVGIVFSDYLSLSSDISPEVVFYKIDDLEKTSFDFLDISIALGDILNNINSGSADLSSFGAEMPFLPYQTAAPIINTLARKIDFDSGSGIRTIVSFQDTVYSSSGISNLYYSFQGLSSDGIYYISVVFPLRAPDLNSRPVSDIDWNSAVGSFNPSLEELDYYMSSIVIE